MASSPQALLSASNCFACLGLDIGQAMILSRLAQILVSANPAADVTTQGLLSRSQCYACYGLPIGTVLELMLLSDLADALAT